MIKRLKRYTHYEKGVEKILNKMDEKNQTLGFKS